MRFAKPLVEGTLIKRRRFQADIKLKTGEYIVAHCPNKGSMMGCSEPGSRVLMTVCEDPRRRFAHELEIIYAGRTPVGIHAGKPASILAEGILDNRIEKLAGYARMHRPQKLYRNTCIDLVLEGNGLRSCYISARNATLAYEQTAFYPDYVMEKCEQQLDELTSLVRQGHRAVLFFLVQRADIERFQPADHIDPGFGQSFRDTIARGVEVICYRAKVGRKGITLDIPLPLSFESC